MNKLTAVGVVCALGLVFCTGTAGFEDAGSPAHSPPAVLGDTGVATLGVEELIAHFTVVAELPEVGEHERRYSTGEGT